MGPRARLRRAASEPSGLSAQPPTAATGGWSWDRGPRAEVRRGNRCDTLPEIAGGAASEHLGARLKKDASASPPT